MSIKNLGDLITPQHPTGKVAIIDTLDWENPREYTYGMLNHAIDGVARALSAAHLTRGARVGILSANRAEYLIAYFGIMRAGMVAVPMNFKLPRSTVEFVLKDAGISFLFCDEERSELCADGTPYVVFGRKGSNGFDDFLNPGPFRSIEPANGEVAMLLYTSGSTGRPKGVPITHEGQFWAVEARSRNVSLTEHRFLIAAPFFHMNGLFSAKLTVLNAASAVLMPRFNARQYIQAIERFKCTWLTSVPTMLAMVARETETLAKTDLSSVKVAGMASAPVTEKLAEDVARIFPAARVSLNFGTTEAGAAVFGVHPEGKPRPTMSIGYPLPDISIRLIPSEGSNDPDVGIVQMKTPATMTGYQNLPEVSAKAITPDGWYNTGDIMRRDKDGFFYFIGRNDDMFVCGGENIYPSEVEQMLERHPQVLQTCVVAVPDELKGQKPVAFAVAKAGTQLTEQSVKDFALANAPAYQHPRRVFIVNELPLAGTNKIDRALLTRQAIAQLDGGNERRSQ